MPTLSLPQRVITAHLVRFRPTYQYLLDDISLTRSEWSLGPQSSQRFKACPTDPNYTIFGPAHSEHVPLTLRFRPIPLLMRRHGTLSGHRLLSVLDFDHRNSQHVSMVRFGSFFPVKCCGLTSTCSWFRTHPMCLPELCAQSVQGSCAN